MREWLRINLLVKEIGDEPTVCELKEMPGGRWIFGRSAIYVFDKETHRDIVSGTVLVWFQMKEDSTPTETLFIHGNLERVAQGKSQEYYGQTA